MVINFPPMNYGPQILFSLQSAGTRFNLKWGKLMTHKKILVFELGYKNSQFMFLHEEFLEMPNSIQSNFNTSTTLK